MSKISKEDDINLNLLKEWEQTRAILSFFDGKLYDLRKYGFSFITALISTEGLLITYLDPQKIWPDDIKFAILFVTILMILGLTIIDRTFFVIQTGACHRARILERIMHLELSEIIESRYSGAKLPYFTIGLYAIFVAADMLLATFILNRGGIFYILLIIIGIVAIVMMVPILLVIRPNPKYGETDWRVDRLRYVEKEKVGITLTNLSRKKLRFSASPKNSKVMWEVKREGEKASVSGEYGKINKDLEIEAGCSHTWFWPTEKTGDGSYRVYRRIKDGDKDLLPMQGSIRIVKEKVKPKPEPNPEKLVK